ncbi:MAG: rod shape-determining protein MreC [bacterium]
MPPKAIFKNKFILYLTLLILLIFLHFINLLKPIENFISYIFLPIQSELYSAGNSLSQTWENANLNNKELVYQNQQLKEKINELTAAESKMLELQSENASLRKQLNFVEESERKYITGRVVGNNLQYNINSYILDKGSDDGIKTGQAVVAIDGIVVGKIRQVFPKESELLLLSDNQSAIAAIIQNKETSQGIVDGQYGISMKMNLIPQNEQINPNDMVITSGIEQNIPRGLFIGQVGKVEANVNELFQSAIIYPPIDYKKLNIVMVIID